LNTVAISFRMIRTPMLVWVVWGPCLLPLSAAFDVTREFG
jgi:hypothetical protein